jgi:hypothetical protein
MLTFHGDELVQAEEGLHAEQAAGAALAGEAVARGDKNWFALETQLELAAGAGRFAFDGRRGSHVGRLSNRRRAYQLET